MNGFKQLGIVLLTIAAILALSSCSQGGSVTVEETAPGQAYAVTMTDWNGTHTLTMNLSAGDEVRVEIQCSSGSVSLEMTGKSGSAPYSGKALSDMMFTVSAEEADSYTFEIKGSHATGSLGIARRTDNILN